MIDRPSCLDIIPFNSYNTGFEWIQEENLLSIIDGPKQYFLSSWFYGYRNSCMDLWHQHFIDVTNEEISSSTKVDKELFRVNTKDSVVEIYYQTMVERRSRENVFFFRKRKWEYVFQEGWEHYYESWFEERKGKKPYRDLYKARKMAKKELIKEFVKNVVRADSSIIEDYFRLILACDFDPTEFQVLKTKKKWENKRRYSRSVVDVKMKFFSQKWQKYYLLRFNIRKPYLFKIKEL